MTRPTRQALGLCGGVGVDDLSQDRGRVRVGVFGDHPGPDKKITSTQDIIKYE
jgi:hypothetical protein